LRLAIVCCFPRRDIIYVEANEKSNEGAIKAARHIANDGTNNFKAH